MDSKPPPIPESIDHGCAVGPAPEDAATLNSSFLEFLNDELVFGSEALDPATLEVVCQVANTQQRAASGGAAIKPDGLTQPSAPPGPSGPSMKRPFEDPNYSESDEEDEGGKGDKTSGKRTKGGEMSAAATKKACREKARREKLNERFLDLARLVDPSSEPKTDKNTILTDAIKYVQQVTVENHQLRQLNKFLEERVSALERERGQQLYQQSLMMSAMGQGQMMAGGQPVLVGAPPGMMAAPGMPGGPMSHPQLAMPVAAMASTSNPLLSAAAGMPTAPTPPLPSMQPAVQQAQTPQQQQQQAAAAGAPGGLVAHGSAGLLSQGSVGMVGSAAGPMMGQGAVLTQMPVPGGPQAGMAPVGAAAAASAGVTFNMGVNLGPGAGGAGPSKPVMVNAMPGVVAYPAMYWLPPQMMDSTQDSLLRPPAA